MIFTIRSAAGKKFKFICAAVVDGVPLDPVLPARFDDTPTDLRSIRHWVWWGVPYIKIHKDTQPDFVKFWKGETRYDVRCLDGGSWDRSTVWGQFGELAQAVALAKKKTPPWCQ